jgi:two-component system, chemotaxis family, chemotaxis protein CheY
MATPRVLVVDDLAFIKLIIRDILEKRGFQVVGEASNGIEAIELYTKVKPDVVLMDITMPRMDGIQALSKIMEIDKAAKVIMCSALGQQRLIIQAIQLGAKDFIVKPFKAERIIGAIKKTLNIL